MNSNSDQRAGLWERLFPQDMKKKLQGYPTAFLTIGAAIGMVVMVLLFYYFEEAIKSWAGFSPLAFGLLGVYTGIAWFILRRHRRCLEQALED